MNEEKKPNEKKNPINDAKIAQFTELNNRSRWYSSQLWQVPFAYLGITAVAITQVTEKHSEFLPYALIACALFGICVLVHIRGMIDGEKRAVKNLETVEQDDLHLRHTTEYHHRTYVEPLRIAVVILVLGYAVIGSYLLYLRYKC